MRALVLTLALAGAGLGPLPAGAQDSTTARPPARFEDVTLNGFVSTSYGYNFNRPASGRNGLRVFDFDDNSFKLDVFELVVQRPLSKRGDAGFRADVELGSSVPRVSSSPGLFRTDSTVDDADLQQAFLSYVAPAGSGLRIDAGKFITHFGYEVIEGYDGWNDNASRSLLFGYAIPFTHTGVHASYTFSPRVAVMMMLVNGWDLAQDNNHSKSVGGQLSLTPSPRLTVLVNGMAGPERRNRESDSRVMLDVVAIARPSERLALGVNGDWGTERGAVTPGAVARWNGYAGYARLAVGGGAVSLRGEVFEDLDGARTGTAQRLTELTLTPEWRLTPHLLLRADLRADRSDRKLFEKWNGTSTTQPTLLLNVLGSF